jgi:hypothetical protein
MNEHSSRSIDYKHKELLYNLFYELTSEIKGCKIEIDEDEYQQNIRTIQYNKLIYYVRDLIQILLKNKNDYINELQRKIKGKREQIRSENDLNQYEALLKQMEERKRKLLKRQFQHRLQRETMEQRLFEYSEMEAEFEEMKTKFKYEEGKFLTNDRKDNEIVIIRSENTILKKEITELETKVKNLTSKLDLVQIQNKELSIQLEEKQKELNRLQNININNQNTTHHHTGVFNEKYPFCCHSVSTTNEQSSKRDTVSSSPKRKTVSNNNYLKVSSSTINNSKPGLTQNNNKIKTYDVDLPDKTKTDFIFKYLTNRHHHKTKSQLNKSTTNHSSIKISKLPNYSILNLSYKNLSTKNQIPSINHALFNVNQINSYKQLFPNHTPSASTKKRSSSGNNSYAV